MDGWREPTIAFDQMSAFVNQVGLRVKGMAVDHRAGLHFTGATEPSKLRDNLQNFCRSIDASIDDLALPWFYPSRLNGDEGSVLWSAPFVAVSAGPGTMLDGSNNPNGASLALIVPQRDHKPRAVAVLGGENPGWICVTRNGTIASGRADWRSLRQGLIDHFVEQITEVDRQCYGVSIKPSDLYFVLTGGAGQPALLTNDQYGSFAKHDALKPFVHRLSSRLSNGSQDQLVGAVKQAEFLRHCVLEAGVPAQQVALHTSASTFPQPHMVSRFIFGAAIKPL